MDQQKQSTLSAYYYQVLEKVRFDSIDLVCNIISSRVFNWLKVPL